MWKVTGHDEGLNGESLRWVERGGGGIIYDTVLYTMVMQFEIYDVIDV